MKRPVGTIVRVVGAALLLLGLTAPNLLTLMAPGFGGQPALQLSVDALRLMLPYLAFAGPVAVMAAALNAHDRVALTSFSPVLFNLMMITAIASVLLAGWNERSSALALAATVGVAGCLQLAFLGPYDQGGPWQLTDIHGVARFLNRVWQEQFQRAQAGWPASTDNHVLTALAQATEKIGHDAEEFKFNTAIAELMKTLNTVSKAKNVTQTDWQNFLLLLAPFAPFIAEELWYQLGQSDSIHTQQWPNIKVSQKQSDTQTDISVQVNGKFRAVVSVEANETEQQILELAMAHPGVIRHIDGKQIIKHIYVPGKVLNLVVR